jgi:hypothetical protein
VQVVETPSQRVHVRLQRSHDGFVRCLLLRLLLLAAPQLRLQRLQRAQVVGAVQQWLCGGSGEAAPSFGSAPGLLWSSPTAAAPPSPLRCEPGPAPWGCCGPVVDDRAGGRACGVCAGGVRAVGPTARADRRSPCTPRTRAPCATPAPAAAASRLPAACPGGGGGGGS